VCLCFCGMWQTVYIVLSARQELNVFPGIFSVSIFSCRINVVTITFMSFRKTVLRFSCATFPAKVVLITRADREI